MILSYHNILLNNDYFDYFVYQTYHKVFNDGSLSHFGCSQNDNLNTDFFQILLSRLLILINFLVLLSFLYWTMPGFLLNSRIWLIEFIKAFKSKSKVMSIKSKIDISFEDGLKKKFNYKVHIITCLGAHFQIDKIILPCESHSLVRCHEIISKACYYICLGSY